MPNHVAHFDAKPDERESFVKTLPSSCFHGDGYSSRVSPRSKWTIIELDFWADPRKNAEWAQEMVATIGMQRFQREFLRNWTLSTQSPFFPEYLARGGDDSFVRRITELGEGPLFLGLDFGFRRPALVAGQTNPRRTRLYVIREWMPQNISAGAFMQVAEWLVGELPHESLGAEALKHTLDLERAALEGKGPTVPWFNRVERVVRYAGAEALRTSQEVANETQEKRVADIWQANGFPLNLWTAPVKARELVLRHLLRAWPPGRSPYLIVDPSCKIIREALSGGYTFKRPSRMNPAPDEPAKDGYYEHLMDALMYMAGNAIDPKAAAAEEPEPTNPKAREVPTLEAPKRNRDVYSRNEDEDQSSAFSTAWGGNERRGIYDRGE